ncbi:hypothetical protein TNCV_355441 [Trichonephila clavipes]|uniref:Uncharacterized protein n=1 Tax=Trichonephila clavipes TaxID=2585209 RepID=A0A8X6W0X1_TRICX|nr:hypothetical protein TNCV_355441 [Trichonephila clavipes]
MTCYAVLLEPQLLDIMIVQFRNEKVSNHGSIPITIDCNVVAFIVFVEGFHQPIKRTKQLEYRHKDLQKTQLMWQEVSLKLESPFDKNREYQEFTMVLGLPHDLVKVVTDTNSFRQNSECYTDICFRSHHVVLKTK